MMKRITATILLSVICSSAFADMEDVLAIGAQTVELVAQFAAEAELLNKQIDQLGEQAKKTQEQIDMMTETNKYGDKWYGENELWMPENIEEFDDWSASSDQYRYYDEIFPHNPEAIDPHNMDSRERDQYAYSAKWNNYSRAAFKKRFDEAQATVKKINEMIKEANQLESPKQSADFQIRMMGEVAKLSQQQTELQALQLHLMTIQLEEVKLSKEHSADFWKYTYEN